MSKKLNLQQQNIVGGLHDMAVGLATNTSWKQSVNRYFYYIDHYTRSVLEAIYKDRDVSYILVGDIKPEYATFTFQKEGEVVFDVSINTHKTVDLEDDYEGDVIVLNFDSDTHSIDNLDISNPLGDWLDKYTKAIIKTLLGNDGNLDDIEIDYFTLFSQEATLNNINDAIVYIDENGAFRYGNCVIGRYLTFDGSECGYVEQVSNGNRYKLTAPLAIELLYYFPIVINLIHHDRVDILDVLLEDIFEEKITTRLKQQLQDVFKRYQVDVPDAAVTEIAQMIIPEIKE